MKLDFGKAKNIVKFYVGFSLLTCVNWRIVTSYVGNFGLSGKKSNILTFPSLLAVIRRCFWCNSYRYLE